MRWQLVIYSRVVFDSIREYSHGHAGREKISDDACISQDMIDMESTT